MSRSKKTTPEKSFRTAIARPLPREMVRDPDLQLSLAQLTNLMNLAVSVRLQIVSNIIAPKLGTRIATEHLKNLDAGFQNQLSMLTSEYLLNVLCLPILGEKASVKKHLQKFLKVALKLQPLLDKEEYTVLVNGLIAGSTFEVAATLVFNLSESLKAAIAASESSIEVMSSNQRSVLESCRLGFALTLANALETRQLEIHADPNSYYVRVLRAYLWTVHCKPDEDGTDVLRTARNAIALKQVKRNDLPKKKTNSVEVLFYLASYCCCVTR